MKKVLLLLLCVVGVFCLAGCAAKTVSPDGLKVKIVYEKPQGDCTELGEVVGTQGNWFTGGMTPNKQLVEGARNDMRNEAGKMGATHVWLRDLSAHTGAYSETVNALGIGVAYRCQ
ncbi:DUF4156 domain-containing protein [Desulfovibrio litoralis]|uniref:DUF4156 domain-containing protein n=1 Tax=Desulfovibrio litoralis DSM 11393 TaxID=1121455 RepID=A0A1M7T884_9BACT|nr:DUF4156 domain-containing protein [Desulfovibrio litoralis]SHN66929.1 protein of unknown function [Desulfovibrio litoralis DSM 11393]